MMKKIVAAIFILSAAYAESTSASNLSWLWKHENVEISSPAMTWERCIHAQMAGRYAAMLSEELRYSGKISLHFDDYLPEYTGVDRKYMQNYTKKKWCWKQNGERRKKMRIKMNTISINENSDKVDLVDVLKLLEFAIQNRQVVADRQEEVEFAPKYHDPYITQALPQTLIDSILQLPVSAAVVKVLSNRIYRNDIEDENRSTSYYTQNGKFYVYKEGAPDIEQVTTHEFDHIWKFCPLGDDNAIVFDTPQTFRYIQQKTMLGIQSFISQQHFVGDEYSAVKDRFYVSELGHQLVLIRIKHQVIVALDKSMIYVIPHDSLIPDLEDALDLDLPKDYLKRVVRFT